MKFYGDYFLILWKVMSNHHFYLQSRYSLVPISFLAGDCTSHLTKKLKVIRQDFLNFHVISHSQSCFHPLLGVTSLLITGSVSKWFLLPCATVPCQFDYWEIFQATSLSFWHTPYPSKSLLKIFLTFWNYKTLKVHILFFLSKSKKE